MRKSIITIIGALTIAGMSAAAFAQGAGGGGGGGGNASSGEGTSSGQAGRSGDRPGK